MGAHFVPVDWADAQTGDVWFGHSSGFVAAAIRFGTLSRVNHAAIVTGRHDTAIRSDEAQANGYRPVWRQLDDSEIETVLRPPYQPGGRDLALRKSTSLLGSKYDYRAIAWLLVRQLTGGHISRNKQRPGRVFCSDAVALCLEAASFDLGDVWQDDPAKLRERLLAYPRVPPGA